MEGKNHIYLLCFGIPKKTLSASYEQTHSLKHVQCFDAYNSNQKKGKNTQFTTLCNTCNITTPFESARGIFMDIEYDHN